MASSVSLEQEEITVTAVRERITRSFDGSQQTITVRKSREQDPLSRYTVVLLSIGGVSQSESQTVGALVLSPAGIPITPDLDAFGRYIAEALYQSGDVSSFHLEQHPSNTC